MGRLLQTKEVQRGKRHDGRVSPAALAKGRAEMVSVEPCPGYSDAFSVCLAPRFSAKVPRPSAGFVICRLYEEEPQATPSYTDFWERGVKNKTCTTSEGSCHVILRQGVRPSSEFYAFCMQLHLELPPVPPIVQPKCGEDRENVETLCGLPVFTRAARGPDSHMKFGMGELAGVVLLMVYVGWSYAFEYVRVIHETGMSVLVGITIGAVMMAKTDLSVHFNYELFSYVLLPMVIFGAGFNLQKKDFFRYSSYIVALGTLGTVLIFLFIFLVSGLFEFRCQDGQVFHLSSHHRLIMASVLASTDTVAPMAFLPNEAYPLLYSVVFGEGVLNDVVSILLSTAAANSAQMPSLGSLLADILYFLGTSAFVGVVLGLNMSLVFKWARRLQEETLKPCAVLMMGNYACYIVAEILDFSSIFSLFVCALLCGHYAKHSLSADARHLSTEMAEFFSYMAEAFVFGYFGLTAVPFLEKPSSFSPMLIVGYSLCIVAARFGAVLLLTLILRLLRCGQRHAIQPRELCVVSLAGCMRGTIAFALIHRAVPPDGLRHRTETVMVTTVLGIVLMNCLVFGGAFPLALRLLGLTAGPAALARQPSPGADPPAQPRNCLHKGWRHVDDAFLKPAFRARGCGPGGADDAEGACGAASPSAADDRAEELMSLPASCPG